MEIRPFHGWRYRPSDGNVSHLIAPPYDILSAADKQTLLAASAHNIVGVDMPHVPPKEAGPDVVYRAAAERLSQWQAAGVLAAEPTPSLYAYEQTFTWAGRPFTRRALICGVRATKFGEDVIPHEHTFAGPKADRLKLTQATAMQLSPIFGFYTDGGAVVKKLFGSLCCPTVFGELGGVKEKLWVVSDAATIADISRMLRDKPAFIADGHHRYTTAMNYRDTLAAAGKIGPDHEANFVMFALVERDDPGMKILPTHRVLRGLSPDFNLAKLAQAAKEFSWQKVDAASADLSDADAFLGKFGPGAMAFVEPPGKELWIARLADPQAMKQAAPDKVDAWRQLDVSVLHELILDRALAPWRTDALTTEYTPQGPAVLAACRSGAQPGSGQFGGSAQPGHSSAQLGAIIQSTPLAAVEKIALSGEVMPHKSTYFYPKLATGMVLKPLA